MFWRERIFQLTKVKYTLASFLTTSLAQEMARVQKERSERERKRAEQERRKEQEEEDALEKARLALAGGAAALQRQQVREGACTGS